jgi:GT2 family glycosyltransferase
VIFREGEKSIMLSVIVLNYNDSMTTSKFVSLISNYSIVEKIIIVDNASQDGSYESLLHLANDKVDVIKSDKNGGYGYGNNIGIKYALNKYATDKIIISNPDVEISENTIIHCLSTFDKHDDCAIVSPMMKNNDESINYKCVWKIPTRNQYLFFSVALLGRFLSDMYYKPEELCSNNVEKCVDCVAGSFVMIDAEKMLRHGMYDENIFLFCEETVLGLKFNRANMKSFVLLDDYFIHHHAISIDKSISSKLKQRELTWKSRLYVLKTYYKTNFLIAFFDHLVAKVEMIEFRLKSFLKRFNLKSLKLKYICNNVCVKRRQ